MTFAFFIIGLVTLGSAMAAMSLRNLVHCALCLAVTFAGLAGLYLQLNAQFAGFAQVLVYVGAVAILIVFTILLTRGIENPSGSLYAGSPVIGLGIAGLVFGVFAAVFLTSRAFPVQPASTADTSVRQLGDQLMSRFILPLEVLGLLLTAALIGAVILAMNDGPGKAPGGRQ